MFGGRTSVGAGFVGALAFLSVVAGCASSVPSGESSWASAPATFRAPADVVADARVASVVVYSSPGRSKPELVLPNPWQLDGLPNQPIPLTFFVVQVRHDGWVQVLLPVRPNGSTGWLAPGTASLFYDAYRITVSLAAHRITVLKSGAVLYTGPVATGTASTPTPTGLFYIQVLLRSRDPGSPYGPYAYGLSAHSDALTTFNGGDAEIGLHGNNDASLLGRNVSHGCIRMDNAAITRLVPLLPLGTPVYVTA